MLFRGDGSDSVRLTHDGGAIIRSPPAGTTSSGRRRAAPPSAAGWGKAIITCWCAKTSARWRSSRWWTTSPDRAPKAKSYKFPMPGDEHVVQYDAWLVDADGMCIRNSTSPAGPIRKSKFPVQHDAHTDRYAWLVSRSRTCDSVELCRVDFAKHRVEPIIRECANRPRMTSNFVSISRNEGRDILWWSERTDTVILPVRWKRTPARAVTSGEYVAGKIERIDTLARDDRLRGLRTGTGCQSALPLL